MQDKLILCMIEYFRNDPKRINHFIKVNSFANLIAQGENVGSEKMKIIDVASIVHDIGIKISEDKYNSSAGKYQELEGPNEAKKMLSMLKFEDNLIERVCYLVGHHHTYKDIVDIDYQILVEADFIVNIYEDNSSRESVESIKKKIFKTNTGINIIEDMFL